LALKTKLRPSQNLKFYEVAPHISLTGTQSLCARSCSLENLRSALNADLQAVLPCWLPVAKLVPSGRALESGADGEILKEGSGWSDRYRLKVASRCLSWLAVQDAYTERLGAFQ
jgi:hypothetical protein